MNEDKKADTECAACGAMHVGGARMSRHNSEWPGVIGVQSDGVSEHAPLCDACGALAPFHLWPMIRSRGGWPRAQQAALAAEQKPWVPAVGEMCEGVNIATGLAYRGHYHGPDFWNGHVTAVLTERKGEISPGQHMKKDSLRPIQSSPPAPAATEQGNAVETKTNPYARTDGMSEASVEAMQANVDRIRKQGQARRELERAIKGPRYPYAESSSVFSSATWESE